MRAYVKALAVGWFLAAFVLACPPAPGPILVSSNPDAAATYVDASPDVKLCAAACANLLALHCQEGAPSCFQVCTLVADTGLTDFHTACLVAATTQAQARACGSVACPASP
jgi:hypothetical protein